MTEVRGKDEFAGIRYDEKTGDVLSRCSSCNIYRKRDDFASSLFSICKRCRREASNVKEAKKDIYAGIHEYVRIGKRRDLELVLWRSLKPVVLAKSKRPPGIPGRPNIQKAKNRVISEVFSKKKDIPKKYRPALLQLIADNALPPAHLVWLMFRPALIDDGLLRLCAIDTARAVVQSSDLQSICDVSYFYDDAEHIARFPDSAIASQKAQKDLRLRVAKVAKDLSKRRKVLKSTWDAYDALLCSIHSGSKKAAESTAYHYVQIQTQVWGWREERALRKLVQIYSKRLEEHSGVVSKDTRARLVAEREEAAKKSGAKSYWVSCNSIYPDDRYLAMLDEDEKHATLLVFHNPKNEIEIGRTFKVLKTQLEPGPDGYLELSKEELESQGIELP